MLAWVVKFAEALLWMDFRGLLGPTEDGDCFLFSYTRCVLRDGCSMLDA
jgi:hypothetical protein